MMKKLGFVLSNAVNSMLSKKLLTFIITITVAAGFVIPSMFTARLSYDIKTYKESLYTDIEKTAMVDVMMEYSKGAEIDSIIGGIKGVDSIGYFAFKGKTVSCGDASFQANIAGISPNYYKLKRNIVLDGRMITSQEIAEGKNVCVVMSYHMPSNYIPKVGDMLKIGNEEYEVVGLAQDPTMYGGILIPYSGFEKMIGDKAKPQLQYVICLHSDSTETAATLAGKVRAIQSIAVINGGYAVKMDKEWRGEKAKPMIKTFALSGVLMLFSLINFIIIFYGKFLEDKYRISLKLLLGESKLGIFAELFVQTFIFFQIAFAADGLIVKLVMPRLTEMPMMLDLNYILMSEGMCIFFAVVIALIVTAVSLKKIRLLR